MYMEEVVLSKEEEEGIDLPPGFRFHPTDEEIISHYLTPKVMNSGFKAIAVGEADLNKSEPWDLPDKGRSSTGEKENYFFCQRDRKYPTGMRTNRATAAGYWKATGKDKEIYRGRGCLVGMKKTLVFYKGRAPKGEKTNWVMHEFRLEGKLSYCNLPKGAKDEWVVCRIFHKNTGAKKSPIIHPHDLLRMNSFGDELFDYASLPPLMDSGPTYSDRPGCSYLQDHIISTPNSSAQHYHHQQQPLKSSYINMGYNQQPHDDQESGGGGGISFIMHPNSNFGSYPNPRCKLEQFSSNTNNNQSIPSLSQDTGLSTEINNNEISSKQIGTSCTKSFEDITDLDTFWADDDYN